MKNLPITIFLMFVSAVVGFSQNVEAELEILKIHRGLDEAFLKGDVTYFESHFAPDYVYSNNFGEQFNRTQNLDFYRSFKTKPPFKVLANSSDNVKIKVNGNAALLTADWSTTVRSLSDKDAEPHNDTGRFTVFYERRDGKWLVVAEHSSEKNHDQKLMEQQVLKAGRNFLELVKRLTSGSVFPQSEKSRDVKALNLLFADEYFSTDIKGKTYSRSEDLEYLSNNKTKLESAELSERKVRVISNYTVIETGKIRYVGSNDHKPFDVTKRYTTTWIWRDFRWQIAADHSSAVQQ